MVVSMGSTGATMATAVMALACWKGLERPCIGGNFLGVAPNTTVVDLGSNVDCRPSLLLSFAALGLPFPAVVWASRTLGWRCSALVKSRQKAIARSRRATPFFERAI